MSLPTFALHTADAIIVRGNTVPAHVRARWSTPLARLRRLLDADPARSAQLARLAEAIRAGRHRIDVQAIADGLLASVIRGQRH